jgi:hypothetical protein
MEMWPLSPVLAPLCLTWVLISAPTQNENEPSAKSESVAVVEVEERVSARNDEKQPESRPASVRSRPPSKSALPGKTLAVPLFGVYVQGELASLIFEIAQTA